MIRQPAAFLFDEPLSNLDAELRVAMRSEISQLQRSLGTTTVYVTHVQVEAMTMGDRISVMSEGKIMQIGSPTELYRKPANVFVAGFIGNPKMNLLEYRDGSCCGSPCLLAKADTGKKVLLGVRPEHVQISYGPAAGDEVLRITGEVARFESLGHECLLQVDLPTAAQRITVRVPGDEGAAFDVGAMVTLGLPGHALQMFDAETGDRLP